MDIVIRTARAEELDEAGRITAEAFVGDGHTEPDGDYVVRLRDARLRAAEAELLVAVDADGGAILGCVTFAPYGSPWADIAAEGEAEFRMLAVSSAARGRGAGEALVRSCAERARSCGAARLVMSTQPGMTHAHRVYGRLGFRRTPARDWSPVPGIHLQTFELPL